MHSHLYRLDFDLSPAIDFYTHQSLNWCENGLGLGWQASGCMQEGKRGSCAEGLYLPEAKDLSSPPGLVGMMDGLHAGGH